MGIYIPKMEMPKKCEHCWFFGCDSAREYWCYLGKFTLPIKGGVPDDCPLVEVKPHGRLIDERWLKDAMVTTLEALIKNPKMDAQEMHIIAAFNTLREMIDDAPTIIDAESTNGEL